MIDTFTAPADKDAHLMRLRRVEGQVRALQRMVAGDVYCIDVLTQFAAATNALRAVAIMMLEEHLRRCLTHAVGQGEEEAMRASVKEATEAIARLVKS